MKRFRVVIEGEINLSEDWYDTGSVEEMIEVETSNFVDDPEAFMSALSNENGENLKISFEFLDSYSDL
jgi:hypothetical protein